MKKLAALLTIAILLSFSASAQLATGTITKRDTSVYSKPLSNRIVVHTDNDLYYWDVANQVYRRDNGTKTKIWTANLTQSSTTAPTWTALDTLQIPGVVFTRDSTGSYKATATGKFTLNRTEVYFSGLTLVSNIPGQISVLEKTVNFIRFCTTRTDTGAKTDAYLSGTTMNIKVNF